MTEFLSLFPHGAIWQFLESLAASSPAGTLLSVPLIMLMTALAVMIPSLLILCIYLLVRKFALKRRNA